MENWKLARRPDRFVGMGTSVNESGGQLARRPDPFVGMGGLPQPFAGNETLARRPDRFVGMGKNWSGVKKTDLAPGSEVPITVEGVTRLVTIVTCEALRDGSGFNIMGTYPGGYIDGFVSVVDGVLEFQEEERKGYFASKSATSKFKVGDRVFYGGRQVVLKRIELSTSGSGKYIIDWAAVEGHYSGRATVNERELSRKAAVDVPEGEFVKSGRRNSGF
jgi:hypothetical protein